MLAAFLKDLIAMPFQLQDYVACEKPLEAKRLLHTLKGLAATLGANELALKMAPLERQVDAQTGPEHLAHVADQASAAIHTASPGLLALLGALQTTEPPVPDTPTDAPTQAAPLDTAALADALRALALQLQNADMDAMQSLARIQEKFGPALRGQLDPLSEAMTALEFDAALAVCRTLVESLSV